MTALVLATDQIMTEHGWLTRHYRPHSTAVHFHGCQSGPPAGHHKAWQYGLQRGRVLILHAHTCVHGPPPRTKGDYDHLEAEGIRLQRPAQYRPPPAPVHLASDQLALF